MTRETKVGLLVGLGIILLIGIIVSDHLSVAQHQNPATLTDLAGQTQQSINTTSTPSRANRKERLSPSPQTRWGSDTDTRHSRPLPMPAELTSPQRTQELKKPLRPRRNTLVSADHQPTPKPRLMENPRSAMPTLSQTRAGQPDTDDMKPSPPPGHPTVFPDATT